MSGFGDTLRHARANKGVTLTEAERAIRIPRKYLRALEDEDFETLPEGVYSRGIVRNYAQYLNLDPDDAIAFFDDLRGHESGPVKVVPAVKPMEVPSHWAPNFALIAFMVVISAVLFAWLYSALFAARDALPTVTPGFATPTPIDTTAAIVSLTPTVTPTPAPTATPAPSPTATATSMPSPTGSAPPTPRSAAPGGAAIAAPATATPLAVAAVQPVQPAPRSAAPPPPPPPTPTRPPAPRPTPTPALPDERHVVTIRALETAWVEVTVDGKVVYAANMPAGRSLDVDGSEILIHSGNAQNVFLWVDGEAWGMMSETDFIADISVP